MNYTNLKKFFNEITDIVYRERLVVAIFISLSFSIKLLFYYLESTIEQPKFEIIEGFNENYTKINKYDSDSIRPHTGRLFQFHPSTVSYDDLLALGFSEKVAHIFLNYRNKGGKFYSKADVKKIYGITPSLYQSIEPFIIIDKPMSNDYTVNHQTKSKAISFVDINKASVEEWEALPGIGNFYSQKFISMREGLGAFHSINQIQEVYRFPDSTFQKIKPYLKISQGKIIKINLNTASESDIRKHPYILKWQADDILKNRPIYGLEDLYELRTFKDKEKYKNFEPYFDF